VSGRIDDRFSPSLRRRGRRHLLLAALAAVVALALGCGSSGHTSGGETTPTTRASDDRTTDRQLPSRRGVERAKRQHRAAPERKPRHRQRHAAAGSAGASSPTSGRSSSAGASSGVGTTGGGSSSRTAPKPKPPAPKPEPRRKPKPKPARLVASFRAPNHSPEGGGHWVITVTARSSNGGPAPHARVRYEFLIGTAVVSRQPCKPVAPYTCRFSRGVFRDDILWPERAVGYQLTFRVVLTTSIGSRKFDWPVTVR
jgi:hypothetical protein